MDPNKHWQADVLVAGWPDNVEVQAVFGLLVSDLITSVPNALLSTSISILRSHKTCMRTYKGIVGRWQSTSPCRVYRLGVGKTKLIDGRLCEWNTKKEVLVVLAVVDAIV